MRDQQERRNTGGWWSTLRRWWLRTVLRRPVTYRVVINEDADWDEITRRFDEDARRLFEMDPPTGEQPIPDAD